MTLLCDDGEHGIYGYGIFDFTGFDIGGMGLLRGQNMAMRHFLPPCFQALWYFLFVGRLLHFSLLTCICMVLGRCLLLVDLFGGNILTSLALAKKLFFFFSPIFKHPLPFSAFLAYGHSFTHTLCCHGLSLSLD